MSHEFIDALIHENIEAIKAVPKTDFHNHSTFGTRIERVEKWAGTALQRPPTKMNGLGGMLSYARQTLFPFINSRKGFEFTAEYAIVDAIEDGVKVLEVSFGTRFALFYPDGLKGFISFLDSLSAKYDGEIMLRPELGFIREDFSSQELCSIARKCIETQFFYSIDLHGDESASAPETFQTLFRQAKHHGMKLKAHVGEFENAESIRHAAEVLELDAVQHGISAADSLEIMKWLSDNKIKLNVCPTSNVMLGLVEGLDSHPIRKLYDHGIVVTVNTDIS